MQDRGRRPIDSTGSEQDSAAEALSARLAGEGPPLLLDGATGTELERAGLRTGLPLWSTHALLEAPERVREIHLAHLRAGAEIATANTFRTQRRTLARAGLGDRDAALTLEAVELARDAIAELGREVDATRADGASPRRRCWVAGSLPPLEDCYRPERVPDDASLAREQGRQARLLAEAGVDFILVETMNTRREARAAARAAASTGLPFVVGFVSWQPGRLLSSESLADAAREVLDLGAASVGVNCIPLTSLEASLAALRDLGAGLLVSPNRGQPDDETGFRRSPEADGRNFVDALAPWLEAGATLVGGCCGTTPEDIAELARRRAEAAPG